MMIEHLLLLTVLEEFHLRTMATTEIKTFVNEAEMRKCEQHWPYMMKTWR